jgi:DNA transformation protein and related proteins
MPEIVTHTLELLAPMGSARAKAMFGGHGLYIGELFVAIVAFERVYLRADAATRSHFEAAGCAPFVYASGSRPITMAYFAAPDAAMDSPAAMRPWARLAVEAALRARAAKAAAGTRRR